MNKMIWRRAGSLMLLLLAAILLSVTALGEIQWKQDTAGQRMLKSYVEAADVFLREQGESPVNSLFEMYRGMAVFGITAEDNAEVPEDVEITARLTEESIDSIQVRVNSLDRFEVIASAFLQALFPDEMSRDTAAKGPKSLVKRAEKKPQNSYEEDVEPLNGTIPRAYYAYFPDQYHDGVSWAQMTIIFPLPEYLGEYGLGGGVMETNGPDTYTDGAEGYEGYSPKDDFQHFEVFVSPTPEPESPAGELEETGL